MTDPTESPVKGEPLSDAAFARIYTAVEAEWRGTVESRASRRKWASVAAIAAGSAAIVLAAIVWYAMPGARVIGSVARTGLYSGNHLLRVGSQLHEGDTVEARVPTLVLLQGGGSIRVAAGTALSMATSDRVELRSGEIYVDIPPNLTARATFAVSTSVGLVEHLGTQFDVACVDQAIRVRVREGSVRVSRDWYAQKVMAGTEMLVTQAGAPSISALSPHDAVWDWTRAAAPDFEIDNRKLVDFLRWAARESGRELTWADEPARQTAERVELHGAVRGLSMDEALSRVLATTSLHLDVSPARIRISSGDE